MRWSDILRAAFENLMRRKLRSTLTMLGVLIGTAAIVVTISLGYGAEYTQTRALSEATNLMLITVQPRYDMGGGEPGSRRITKITDSVIADLRRVGGVAAVTPVVMVWGNASFVMRTGRYETYTMMTAVDPEAFAKIQKLKTGNYFTGNTDRMEFIMSEMSMVGFVDTKKKDRYGGYVDVYGLLSEGKPLPLPDIKWLTARYELAMKWQEYDESKADGAPTERELTFAGRMMGTMEANLYDWTFANGPIVNINWLKRMYKANRDVVKTLNLVDLSSYETVLVLAQSVDQVKDITKALNDYGVSASSPMEWIDTIRQQIQTMQGFLGFIGAVSMLVAALSIANTMMMSIYERTREIGVMKVLGCRLSNIRLLFLTEAAYIGLIGGGLGLIASYSLSWALNNVAWLQQAVAGIMQSGSMFSTEGATASIIPANLSLGTWLFVIFISLGSGMYPAYRAMRLSSLAAIRNAD